MFPQVPVVPSVLCCCSLSVAFDWETKVWTQRKDLESFIANYLTRSELEDLWSTSTEVSSLYAQERPLWSAASLTDIPFYLTIVDHQFHKHLWNSKSFLTKHLTAPSNAKYESFLSKGSHLSLFSSSAKTASNLLLFLPFKENLQVQVKVQGLTGSRKAGMTETQRAETHTFLLWPKGKCKAWWPPKAGEGQEKVTLSSDPALRYRWGICGELALICLNTQVKNMTELVITHGGHLTCAHQKGSIQLVSICI